MGGSSEAFDLCVIGGGPAGYAAASRAWDLGRRVLLVERARIGGAGLHAGALSSKTMWELANDYATSRRTDRGYRARHEDVSYPAVIDSVNAAVRERRELLESHLAHMASPSAHGGTVTRLAGEARLTAPHEVSVTTPAGVVVHRADQVLICTGSSPRTLDTLPADGRRVLTSDHLEALPAFPKRLVVLGAGVVGCEYATIFARYGVTEVHLLDREPRILPFEDDDVAGVVTEALRELGLVIHHGHKLARTVLREHGVDCVLAGPGGSEVTVEASHLLLSIGRGPNTRGIGLEALGVEILPNGAIKNEHGRSTVDWIWAAGDTTADIALANVAELEGRHVVEQLFGEVPPGPIPYDALSSILFVQPEVAAVGLNEQQAQKRGLPYRAGVVRNVAVPRNIAMRATRGFVKLLAGPDDKLLGLRVVGPQASSTIQGAAFLIARGGTLHDIDACIHPHPAIPEGVQEAARLLLGRSVLKPGSPGSPLSVRSWSPS